MQSLSTLYRDENFRGLVCEQLAEALSHTLSSITPDPAAFQSMMRRTNTVISGSTALHHVLRQAATWNPTDVDLLVPSHRFNDVLQFVLALPGAVTTKEYSQSYSVKTGYLRIVTVQTSMVKFEIIQSVARSPFHPMLYYYGTHIMNAITADFSICTYPSLTFDNRSYLAKLDWRSDDATVHAVATSAQRGFNFMLQHEDPIGYPQLCHQTITCPHRNRSIGDKYCLVVPNTQAPVATTWDLMDERASTTWRLPGQPCGNPSCYIDGELVVRTTTWGEIRRITNII